MKQFRFPIRIFVFSLQSFFSLTLLEAELRGRRGFDVANLNLKLKIKAFSIENESSNIEGFIYLIIIFSLIHFGYVAVS